MAKKNTSSGLGADGRPFEHLQDNADTHIHESDTLRVPVHEEELTATKQTREIGEVRVDKSVVSEEKVLEIPVTEERVRVERHAVDRSASDDPNAFQEGTFEIPIRADQVDVQKQVRVAEEVEIGKEAVQRTEQVSGTVRHEEVRINEDATIDKTPNR
jgi:uncharacterized protein (TIGR02271 family)